MRIYCIHTKKRTILDRNYCISCYESYEAYTMYSYKKRMTDVRRRRTPGNVICWEKKELAVAAVAQSNC